MSAVDELVEVLERTLDVVRDARADGATEPEAWEQARMDRIMREQMATRPEDWWG
jgi:hypothetical protein